MSRLALLGLMGPRRRRVPALASRGRGSHRLRRRPRWRTRVVLARPLAPPAPPPSAARGVAAADRTAPVISAARLSRARMALPVRRAGQAATIRFRTSERAAVTLTVTRSVRGRTVVDGRLKRGAVRGANAIVLGGRVGTAVLRPGRYVLRLDAVDAAGNRARPRSLRLVVTRR